MSAAITAREWLKANGSGEVAAKIDVIMAEWDAAGSSERRDWWRVCAGGKTGKPRTIAGRTFPVIRAFRVRLGLPDVPNAIANSKNEIAPAAIPQARWGAKPKK